MPTTTNCASSTAPALPGSSPSRPLHPQTGPGSPVAARSRPARATTRLNGLVSPPGHSRLRNPSDGRAGERTTRQAPCDCHGLRRAAPRCTQGSHARPYESALLPPHLGSFGLDGLQLAAPVGRHLLAVHLHSTRRERQLTAVRAGAAGVPYIDATVHCRWCKAVACHMAETAVGQQPRMQNRLRTSHSGSLA